MKFSTLHKQRKYLLISASAGLFSLLLPWISFYTELISETTNGFHSYGIIVFLAFLGSILLILKGDGTQPLDKVKWMTILLSGVVALLFTLIYMESSSEPSIFDTGYGIGIKISLLASTCMIIFSWLLKNKEDDLQNSFISLKNKITSVISSGSEAFPPQTSILNELDKLIKYKEEGKITEEEFQQLKSKIIEK